jgi:dTDP-4-dehydrorhamnose reductase
VLQQYQPAVIVHAAALRDPDVCERRPDDAHALHVAATERMAAWCTAHARRLVYISTDYVFDGAAPPYVEDDPVAPLSVYGRTKAAGEAAARACPRHLVVRMPLQYGFSCVPDDSFLLKVLHAFNTTPVLRVDHRQLRYPTLSDDVALAILHLLAHDYCGTIHLRGATRATRFQMWRAIARVFDYDTARVLPDLTPMAAHAARPADSCLSTWRARKLGVPAFCSFGEGLQQCRAAMEHCGIDWHAL